jgi:phosphate:Na+ symporter
MAFMHSVYEKIMALIVKALSFDASRLSPLLMLMGCIAQKRASKACFRELGRIGIGLGLVLLALHLLVETWQPLGSAQMRLAIIIALLHDQAGHDLLSILISDPIFDVLLTAVVTFAAHSIGSKHPHPPNRWKDLLADNIGPRHHL